MENIVNLVSDSHETFNLLSDVITRRDWGYKTFKYIDTFTHTGLTNSNYIYNIVNFIQERMLNHLSVPDIFNDFELYLCKKKVERINAGDFELYEHSGNVRGKQIIVPEDLSSCHFLTEGVLFDITIHAFTYKVENHPNIDANAVLYKGMFSDTIPLFHIARSFRIGKETKLLLNSIYTHSRSMEILEFLLNYLLTFIKDFDPMDHIIQKHEKFIEFSPDMFHYCHALSDMVRDPEQVSILIGSRIGFQKRIQFAKQPLLHQINAVLKKIKAI